MSFKPLDLSEWKRREYFKYYLQEVPCTYSMTLNVDITTFLQRIKDKKIKLYPTLLYLLSKVLNQHEEFRIAFDEKGTVGIFDIMHPFYAIFQHERETFTNIWTEYDPDFFLFYKAYVEDDEKYGKVEQFLAKPNPPPNVFPISSIPWVSFTGFNLNLPKTSDYLTPIFTLGKFFDENSKVLLPLSIQVHHAVCDGFHLGRFVNELQGFLSNPHFLDEGH